MQNLFIHHRPPVISRGKLPLLVPVDSLPSFHSISTAPTSPSLQCRKKSRLSSTCSTFRTRASNVGFGCGGYDEREEKEDHKSIAKGPGSDRSSEEVKPPSQIPYPLSIAFVLLGCTLVLSLIAFAKGGPSSLLAAIAKSGFTAAFTLIFVSEIGDKTFFIAALLAMQYEKGLVLLGSMGALSYDSLVCSNRTDLSVGPCSIPNQNVTMSIYANFLYTIPVKLVGYLGGVLFLIFAVATFFGVF